MIIRVLDQNYFVQQTLPSEKGLVQYVCTNVSEDDGRVYRIVMIPVQDVKPELIQYLADLYKAGLFHELVQYGNEKGNFHVVMDCGPKKGKILRERLENDVISLAERLTMGDNFLKYLIISSIPVWFAEYSMDTDHILFTDALDCAMIFELEYLERFKEAENRGMQARLQNVLRELFAKELDKEKLPEMRDFLEKILQGEYPELMDLYQEYRRIEAALANVDETSLEPRSLLWRIWDIIKKIVSIAEKCFGFVVFAIAIAYLIWSIWNFLQPTEVRDIYPAIGDEKILSRSGTEETDSSVSEEADVSTSSEASGENTFSEEAFPNEGTESMEAGR